MWLMAVSAWGRHGFTALAEQNWTVLVKQQLVQIQLRSGQVMKGGPLSYFTRKSPHYQNGRHVLLWGYSGQLQYIPAFSRLFQAFPRYSRLFQPISVYSAQFLFLLLLAVALRLWSCALERLLPLGVKGHLNTHSEYWINFLGAVLRPFLLDRRIVKKLVKFSAR